MNDGATQAATIAVIGDVHLFWDDQDVAFFNGSDNKGYFLRVGDRVYDGTVIAIDARRGVVTFRQQVDDPRRIKPYIDVKKRLVPVEEESAQ